MKFGKWIGGGLGWAWGGPIGAIIGFALGSFFDSATIKVSSATSTTTQGDFMASLLVLAAAVMKADGRVVRSELNYLRSMLLAQFGEEATRQYLLMLRDIVNQEEIPLDDVCVQIKNSMDYSSRLELLHFLFRISAADNNVHPAEIKIIQQIADGCGIQDHDFLSIKAMFVKETDSAYKVLELSPDATDDEVKKAYKRMAVKYHPDKVSHLGPELQKASQEKFQQLNAAYNEIKKQRGFS